MAQNTRPILPAPSYVTENKTASVYLFSNPVTRQTEIRDFSSKFSVTFNFDAGSFV